MSSKGGKKGGILRSQSSPAVTKGGKGEQSNGMGRRSIKMRPKGAGGAAEPGKGGGKFGYGAGTKGDFGGGKPDLGGKGKSQSLNGNGKGGAPLSQSTKEEGEGRWATQRPPATARDRFDSSPAELGRGKDDKPAKEALLSKSVTVDLSSSSTPKRASGNIQDAQMARRGAVGDLMRLAPRDEIRQTVFGIGHRIDPQKWRHLVESHAHGGHYEYASGMPDDWKADEHSRRAKFEADFEMMEQICDPRHDKSTINSTAGVAGNEATSPTHQRSRQLTPRAMKIAFTDRSVRLREGQLARKILNYSREVENTAPQESGTAKASTSGSPTKAGQTWDILPAGQPSFATAQNKLIDPTDVGMGHPADQSQVESKGAESVLNMDKGPMPQNDELAFQRAMKRKSRAQSFWTSGETTIQNPQRQSEKASQLARSDVAGGYKRKEIEHNSKKCGPEVSKNAHKRSGVALIMESRTDDPPHPHDRITDTKRGIGIGSFKDNYSDYTDKLSRHWNPGLYRFETKGDGQDRSVSTPPSRNPITHEHSTQEAFESRTWTTHEVSNRNLEGRHAKLLTDFSKQEEDALQDRSNRIATESKFAELCQVATENQTRASQEAEIIKAKNGHHTAHDGKALGIRQNTVASLLCWE